MYGREILVKIIGQTSFLVSCILEGEVNEASTTVNNFKSRLDKFRSMYDFVYDYRASPLAAGS